MRASPGPDPSVTVTRHVFLFPGQGGQYGGMARELFEGEPAFRATMFRADRIVRAAGGRSLVDALFGAGDEAAWLDDLELSHPAIVAAEWAMVEALAARGVRPMAVLGASLGEYAAMATAGMFSFEDMLRLALDQARLALAHAPAGGMMAVLASPERAAETLGGCEIVAESGPDHLVVAGSDAALAHCADALQAMGVTTARLPVVRPFHTPAIAGLEPHLRAAVAELRSRPPTMPVYSCSAGARLDRTDADHLWGLVRGPIALATTFACLEADSPDAQSVEVGPGASLANIARRRAAGRGHRPHAVLNPLSPATPETLDRWFGPAAGTGPAALATAIS